MRTILDDDAATWFLDHIIYKDELQIVVAEGIRSETTEDLVIGQINAGPVHTLEVRAESRRFGIRFEKVVSWQVVMESFTCWDDYESSDVKGYLRRLERSRYFDYVIQNHGWFRDMAGPAKHYRLWTENEVVDIVAHDPPMIEEVTQSDQF